MLFGLLGDALLPLTPVTGHEATFGTEYAEQSLIGGKPQLQRTGDKLDERRLSLTWHHLYCIPELELQKLKLLLVSRRAHPLVLANGRYEGDYVLTDLALTQQETGPAGLLISATAQLTLKEYPRPRVLAEQPAKKAEAPAKKRGGKKPAGARQVTPPARKPGEPICRFVDE